MKKVFLLTAIFFGIIYSASAQYYYNNSNNNNNAPAAKFGFGFSSGFGVGPVSDYYPEAGALSFRFELPVNKSPLSVVLSTGYTFYASNGGYGVDVYSGGFGTSTYFGGAIASFIPIEAGLKLYVSHRVFIEGDAGVSFNVNTYSSDYTGQTTAFIYSPAIGCSFPFGFSNRQDLDVSLLYENRPETGGGYSQFALRAIWNFNL